MNKPPFSSAIKSDRLLGYPEIAASDFASSLEDRPKYHCRLRRTGRRYRRCRRFPALSAVRREIKIAPAVRLEVTVAQGVERAPGQGELLGHHRENWSQVVLICFSLSYPVKALSLLLVIFQCTSR